MPRKTRAAAAAAAATKPNINNKVNNMSAKQHRRIVLGDEELEQELDALVKWHCGSSRVDAIAFLLRHVSPRLRATNPADWLGGRQTTATQTTTVTSQPATPADSIDLNSLFL